MNFSLQSQMPVTSLKEIYKTKDFRCKREGTISENEYCTPTKSTLLEWDHFNMEKHILTAVA